MYAVRDKCGRFVLDTSMKTRYFIVDGVSQRTDDALVGHLALYRQVSPALMKRYVKVRAVAHGYPCETFGDGERTVYEPLSVSKASTGELAVAIDTCYEIASEWGVHINQEEER